MSPTDVTPKTRSITRRVVVGGLVAAAGGAAIVGATSMSSGDYDEILADQLRPLAPDAGMVELVRYGTLAANSHNTQPWRFRIASGSIAVEPDFARRTPVVDPDDHHLFASLGCAAENLSLAVRARGGSGTVVVDPAGEGRVAVSLAPSSQQPDPLFGAIPQRQCSRATYDGSAVPADTIARLEAAARVSGVEPIFLLDEGRRAALLDLIVSGNSAQLDDRAFRTELKSWLRFNAGAAARTRDGLYSAATGNPSLPSWLGPIMYDLTVKKEGDNQKLADQLRSSSGLVVFVAPSDSRAGWVAAGRAYQRFALQATLDGLKHAFVNQAVEVPAIRREVQTLLALGTSRPSLIVRFGRGPDMPRSLRRPVREVLAM